MASSQVIFTPSASATLLASYLGGVVDLPPVDAGSTAFVIQNFGPGTLGIVAGTSPGSVFHAPGCITIHAGETKLVSDPGFAAGTVATVESTPPNQCSVNVMRGSTKEVWLFQAHGAVVL